MINIDEVCEDGEAKYYAAVLSNNAAMLLLAHTSAEAITTPSGSLIGYNVYRVSEYRLMEADSCLPESIKSKLREYDPNLNAEFTTPSLEGLHVLRTPTPLAGNKLRETLTVIQERLGVPFYNKRNCESEIVRDSLVIEEVYKL